MAWPITIFTDRDGDDLSVTPRNTEGNLVPDPIITVTRNIGGKAGSISQSVILKEDEAAEVIVKMVKALNLNEEHKRQIIEGLGYRIEGI